MEATVRPFRTSDVEAIVDLSIRAWAPVFASQQEVLGKEIFVRLNGSDWRTFQEGAVRSTLENEKIDVWVAEGPHVVGFVATTIADPERLIGEVWMLAVDPDHQERGIGTALTNFATDRLRDLGMRVAAIGTGGDPGHAPARRVYEKARYTLMPSARYWMAL